VIDCGASAIVSAVVGLPKPFRAGRGVLAPLSPDGFAWALLVRTSSMTPTCPLGPLEPGAAAPAARRMVGKVGSPPRVAEGAEALSAIEGCPPRSEAVATRASAATFGTCTARNDAPVLARAILGMGELAETDGRLAPLALVAPVLAATWAEPTANWAEPAAAVVAAFGAEDGDRETATLDVASMRLDAALPEAAGETLGWSILATILDGKLTPRTRFTNVLGDDAAADVAAGCWLEELARRATVSGNLVERLMAGSWRPGERGAA
jgi:hypothetical protein